MLAVVIDVFVDLVGHRVRVMPAAQLGDPLELRPGQHVPSRVVRGIQDDGARATREGGRHSIHIQRLPDRHRQEDGVGPTQDGVGSVVLIERFQHDHLVPRVHHRHEGGGHCLRRPATNRELRLRIHRHPVPLVVLAGQRVAQARGSPRHRVLVDVVSNGADRRFLDDLRRRKVGESLRQVDGVVLHGQTGHAADD